MQMEVLIQPIFLDYTIEHSQHKKYYKTITQQNQDTDYNMSGRILNRVVTDGLVYFLSYLNFHISLEVLRIHNSFFLIYQVPFQEHHNN